MEVRNHLLVGDNVRFVQSSNFGGRIEPSMIIAHDTAGALRKFSSVEWFQSPKCKTSAHVVIELDGTITQMVPFDRKAFHAGESVWKGRKYCNGFAIGIEIVNPGKLSAPKDGVCKADGFTVRLPGGTTAVEAESKLCGKGYWMPYTEPQLIALNSLIRALANAYPTITEVVGHHDVSPGRKIDPTPLMPWPQVRKALGKRVPNDVATVKELQARLQSLGYHLGTVDGAWGPRSRSALRDFQEQAGLKTTGLADDATVERLMAENAPTAVVASRDEWTEKDLVENGSSQVVAGKALRGTGKIIQAGAVGSAVYETAATALETANSASEAVGGVENAISTAERAGQVGAKVTPLVVKLINSPTLQIAFCISIVSLIVWFGGHKIIMNRLRAARQGQHVGV